MSMHEPLLFESDSPEAEQAGLQLRAFRGREVVSQLFRYELDVYTMQEGGLSVEAIDDLLNRPCAIRFGLGGTSVLYGRLSAIELVSAQDTHETSYRAEMVPRIWQATLYKRSRVFQHLTSLGIVERILIEHGLKIDVDYTLHAIESNYVVRDYTVQYQETDLDFLCRLLEHEGIFFYFQHGPSEAASLAERDHLVLGDHNQHFARFDFEEDAALQYDPRLGAAIDHAVIRALGCRTEVRPGRVQLVEYNWRRPQMLSADAPCDEATGAESFHHHYGDHFRDLGEGQRLARVRAEELMATRVVYPGIAQASALTSGYHFEVIGHPNPEFDRQYVTIEVEHAVDHRGAEGASARYEKRFVAIAFTTPYRPPRITERPRVDGYVHGMIDSEDVQRDNVAPIDRLGQYTVVVPFDLYGSPGGPASTRRIRMAQPASGNTNIHFPLDVGAEVAIVHLGGDPDRPLIVGSPPHGQARVSVDVAGLKDNRTQSLIESRNGVFIEIEDDW